jgi:hypothetical protein
MKVPLINTTPATVAAAKSLAIRLAPVRFSDVLQGVSATNYLHTGRDGERHRVYDIRFELIPRKEYEKVWLSIVRSCARNAETHFHRNEGFRGKTCLNR